jgi:hypothetical protein
MAWVGLSRTARSVTSGHWRRPFVLGEVSISYASHTYRGWTDSYGKFALHIPHAACSSWHPLVSIQLHSWLGSLLLRSYIHPAQHIVSNAPPQEFMHVKLPSLHLPSLKVTAYPMTLPLHRALSTQLLSFDAQYDLTANLHQCLHHDNSNSNSNHADDDDINHNSYLPREWWDTFTDSLSVSVSPTGSGLLSQVRPPWPKWKDHAHLALSLWERECMRVLERKLHCSSILDSAMSKQETRAPLPLPLPTCNLTNIEEEGEETHSEDITIPTWSLSNPLESTAQPTGIIQEYHLLIVTVSVIVIIVVYFHCIPAEEEEGDAATSADHQTNGTAHLPYSWTRRLQLRTRTLHFEILSYSSNRR